MLRTLLAAGLVLAASAGISQPTQPCTSYLVKDKGIMESAQIASPQMFGQVLSDIAASGYAPVVREKMTSCAFERRQAAQMGVNAPPIPTPTVPETFSPSFTLTPMQMVPATAPQVAPMRNAAPEQILQTSQMLGNLSEQLMLMGDLMSSTQTTVTPTKWSVAMYATKLSAEKVFDETARILSSEKYTLQFTDRVKGRINAVGKPWGRPNSCAAAFISIQKAGSDASMKVIFATYPGCVADKAPEKFRTSFEKDLRKLAPDLTTEEQATSLP